MKASAIKMFATPIEHLPVGYPSPSGSEIIRFAPVWKRASELHAARHTFDPLTDADGPLAEYRYWDGEIIRHGGPRSGIINPIMKKPHYCDCFERAFRELRP